MNVFILLEFGDDFFDNGNSSIDVQSRQRDPISYSGEMVFGK